MVQVKFTTIEGVDTEVQANLGESMMVAAGRNSVPGIEAACGGALACGTCHVYVSEPWFSQLPAPSSIEAEMLECGMHVQANSRLACQIIVTPELEGIVVTTPITQY